MFDRNKFNFLYDIVGKSEEIIPSFHRLLNQLRSIISLNPKYVDYKIILVTQYQMDNKMDKNPFNIGVNRYIVNNSFIIKINKKNSFLPFILLREALNLFINESQIDLTSIQLVINQIIISQLPEAPLLTKWKQKIRKLLQELDSSSNLLKLDRLQSFFNFHSERRIKFAPMKLFFHYIRENSSLIHDNIDFSSFFFNEYYKYISKRMINDEILETISCISKIFYKVKKYKNLLNYKEYFKKFKENGILPTKLSLRKFTQHMDWIKNESLIAPSYQLNYNLIGIDVFIIYTKFNPLIKKPIISKIIKNFPFLVSPKLSNNSFSTEMFAYIIIPTSYVQSLNKFISKLNLSNLLIDSHILIRLEQNHIINLNYYKENFQNKRVICPKYEDYFQKLKIESEIKFFDSIDNFRIDNLSLDLLDFLIFDRIRFFSPSGFAFERRTKTLKILKRDLFDELISQSSLITKLKDSLKNIHQSDRLRKEILGILGKNKKFGLIYIRIKIKNYLELIKKIERIIKIEEIIDINQLKLRLFKKPQKENFKDVQLFKKSKLINYLLKNYFSFYFRSKEVFELKVKRYVELNNLLDICFQLKIFSLDDIIKILKDNALVNYIYNKKEKSLQNLRQNYKSRKLTLKKIEDTLDGFTSSKPPILIPHLINTITLNKYEKDYVEIILHDSNNSREVIKLLKDYFPRFLAYHTKELNLDKNLYQIEISSPPLSMEEKKIFFSYLNTYLKNDIIYLKSFIWPGFLPIFTIRSFYDFDKKKFFSDDLFEQYFLYINNIVPKLPSFPKHKVSKLQEFFWDNVKDIDSLINTVEYKDYSLNLNFSIDHLDNLSKFNLYISKILLNDNKYKKLKKDFFFQNYIDSIRFLPAFSKFNLEQFYIYIYPFGLGEIDYRLLFINSFQEIQYPAKIGKSNSLFIRYLMPFRAPNLSYINWITKSKRAIREYCAFSIKKLYTIFHTNFNLTPEGWDYSADKFKVHMQKVLFDPKYKIKIPELKEFDVSKVSEAQRFGKNSTEFKSLTQIYDTEPIDIKSHLGTKRYPTIKNIKMLLEKDLIFPYISFKNLALDDEINLVLPNVASEYIQKLLKVFSYFNLAHMYEIQGEFFIYGFNEEIRFEDGLFIKLFFPKCELSEFFKMFDKLFDYLDIDHYIILHDLVDGKTLLKNIYGGLDFLDSYNPLLNFEWSEEDKKWINHKIFGYKFEPNYPNLSPKDQIK
jgi:hypothetical protein